MSLDQAFDELDKVRTTERELSLLEHRIAELCAHMDAAEYRLLVLIGEWEARDGLRFRRGFKSTAHWLSWRCGIGLGAAREKVRVARTLPGLPSVSDAFSRGELSYSKVRAITRIANAGNEEMLVESARALTASQLERVTHAYRRAEGVDDPERLRAQRCERALDWWFDDDDGMLVLRGRFAPDDGALLVRWIEAAFERMCEEERDSASADPVKQHRGDFDAEAGDPVAAKRADALLRLAEAGAAGDSEGLAGGERVQVMLHVPVDVSAETPATGQGNLSAETPEPAAAVRVPHLDPGGAVGWQTARRLACDASRVVLKESAGGEPLSIGRRSRTVPAPMRRVLDARDGGCRFPGCAQRRHVDAHHVIHWADGGETSTDNLVLLCRYHHRLVHEEGFGCHRSEARGIFFTLPGGAPIPAAAPPPRLTRAEALRGVERANRDAGIRVSAETCRSLRDGAYVNVGVTVARLRRTARDGPPAF